MSQPDTPQAIEADHPGWRVWRTILDGQPSAWCATRLDKAAGTDATVIEDTSAQLREQLADQRRRIQRGETPFDPADGDIRPGGDP
jgi:hypothetical protein